jgi:hypothetical protein
MKRLTVPSTLRAAGAGWIDRALGELRVFERWARVVTAAVFIGVGVYETLRSTLFLI